MAVLDASAVLAFLEREQGADVVRSVLPGADISAVNLSEVATKLVDRGFSASDIARMLERLGLRVHEFNEKAAYACARLRNVTRPYGLSLGDRACLALGGALAQPVLTADQSWGQLDLGIVIQMIR